MLFSQFSKTDIDKEVKNNNDKELPLYNVKNREAGGSPKDNCIKTITVLTARLIQEKL